MSCSMKTRKNYTLYNRQINYISNNEKETLKMKKDETNMELEFDETTED